MIPIINKWILSSGSLVIFIILSFLVVYILNKIVSMTSKKFSLDARILKSIRTPARLGILLIGLYLANYYLKPSLKIGAFDLGICYKIFAVFVFIYALVSVVRASLIWYVESLKIKKKEGIDDTIFYFLIKVVTVVLYFIAILIVLDILGIKIQPILAGLGIAGLAVALALQDTLGNFFSAIYIAADQPVKIGDFIRLTTGEEGYVNEIGWRSTRLKTREQNIIIIPNSKLSQSVITNYNQVQATFKIEMPIGVSYDSNLEKVEEVTVKTCEKIMKKYQQNVEFKPYIRYETFGESSINFKAFLMVDNVEDKFKIVHEFIKELNKEYNKNKIKIPYPQREVYVRK